MVATAFRSVCWTFVAFCVSWPAMGAPTDLDPSFADAGIARVPGAASIGEAALISEGRLSAVFRLGAGGTVVKRLDAGGRIDSVFDDVEPLSLANDYVSIIGVSSTPADQILVLHQRCLFIRPSICDMRFTRHQADGRIDEAFGLSGVSAVVGGAPASKVIGDAFGRIVLSVSQGSTFSESAALARLGNDGSTLEYLGVEPGGSDCACNLTFDYAAVVVQSDGKPVVLMRGRAGEGPGLRRFVGNGIDFRFDGASLGRVNVPGVHFTDIQRATDDRLIVAGYAISPLQVPQLVVVRLERNGALDTTFGNHGVAILRAGRQGELFNDVHAAVQADGRVVLAATIVFRRPGGEPFPRILLARLTTDGKADTRFAPGGVDDFWSGRGADVSSLLLRPDGRIVVGANLWTDYQQNVPFAAAAVVQFQGGNLPVAKPLRERSAVEYMHAGYGHYFLSADPEEVAVLDTSPTSGWTRTGLAINVWDDDDPSLKPVCRFWSDQTWAPKSSHFYTSFESECAAVKTRPEWHFERNAFKVRQPEGPRGARTCPSGSQPLYRVYNNGMTGAPNHRYMTDAALLEQMIAQGWTMEGEAQTRVFACVPLQ